MHASSICIEQIMSFAKGIILALAFSVIVTEVKVDQKGNLYVSGPSGLWILSPEGKHLGTVFAPMHPHNMAWGDEDGKTLYLTARSGLYRMRLNVPGAPVPMLSMK